MNRFFLPVKVMVSWCYLALKGMRGCFQYQKQQETYNPGIEALWVREAEARYDQIKIGEVTCRSLDEALADAHKELV
jgi:hypothetical protein